MCLTVRCWLLALCFSLFGFCFSLLSCPFSLLAQWLLAAYYLPSPARYSLLATHGQLSLLSSRVRMIIPALGVLFASPNVNILLTDARHSLQSAHYSYHSTLIASYTLFLLARRSLFEICCFLLADRCPLLSSCFPLLFAFHSVLVTRILLLADCCFLFLISLILIKCTKLFTLVNLNTTRNFRSNGLGLN